MYCLEFLKKVSPSQAAGYFNCRFGYNLSQQKLRGIKPDEIKKPFCKNLISPLRFIPQSLRRTVSTQHSRRFAHATTLALYKFIDLDDLF
jgi:hypothetical protein